MPVAFAVSPLDVLKKVHENVLLSAHVDP